MIDSPHLLSLSEQVFLFNRGSVSATDIVKAHLKTIDELNPKFNSFISVDAETAIAQASELDKMRSDGAPLGPLSGSVIAVKDSIPTKALRTTNNSRLLEDWIPEADASVVKRLRDSGAIIIGKTNLNEFGWSIPSESDLNPPPWTPYWDPLWTLSSPTGAFRSTKSDPDFGIPQRCTHRTYSEPPCRSGFHPRRSPNIAGGQGQTPSNK